MMLPSTVWNAVAQYVWPTAPLAVAFDDKCSMCQNFRRLTAGMSTRRSGVSMDSAQAPRHAALKAVQREARLDTLHAVDGDTVVHGFGAVSALARRTIMGPVLAPLVAAFEFSPAGEAIYAQVNRYRKCTNGHCQQT